MGIADSLDISPSQRKTLVSLLNRHIPGVTVWAYGSRVKWTSRPDSDLDLVAFVSPEKRGRMSALKEAFEDSSLPFRVDLMVWDEVPENFRKNILEQYLVLVEKAYDESQTHGGELHKVAFERLLAAPVRNGIYKPKEFHGRGMKIVNMGELFAHPRLRSVPMKRVELSSSETERFSLLSGDLLFARRSLTAEGAGKCCIVLDIDEPTTYESSIIRARPNSSKADSLFLYYFFNSPSGLHALDTIRRHVAVAGITGTDLASLEISVPSLPEQRAIAHILGTLDDKIELNRRMNETLEAMARALFNSWFVDFEPVRAKAEGRDTGLPKEIADLFPDSFEDSELGEVPKGWQIKSLYDTATFINGAAFKNDDFCESGTGLPVIKIAELKDGICAQTKYSCRNADDKQLINTRDLLYSWSGSPDTSLDVFIWANGPGLLNQHIFKVVTVCDSQKRFVYYLLKYLRPVLVETARNKQTTGLGHITVADMKRLQICSPPPHVLAAFNNAAAQLFDKAFFNTLETRTLAAQRDALLPKLLSGEVRVSTMEAKTC